MTESDVQLSPLPAAFVRVRGLALVAGAVAIVLCLIGWVVNPAAAARAYLFAYLFVLGLALGSLAWVMMHHLVGGGWGRAIQRIAEAGALTLVLMAVLFLPIVLSARRLYPWANEDWVAKDAILRHKAPYLNFGFWMVRAVVYFAIWIALALLMARGSSTYDRTGSLTVAKRMRRLSAAGLVIYVLTMTFAGVDWIMSREAHYFSTVFGFIMVVGQSLSALLMLVIVLTLLVNREPLRSFVTRGHFNDLGNLMLTCVILWAYVAFAQFLISWTGNIQEEVKWYDPRMHGFYGFLGALMIIFHFFVPFLLLLSKHLKRHPEMLARLAGALLAIRLIDLFWMVAPSGRSVGVVNFLWLSIVAPIAIGGLWLGVFLFILGQRPLLAVSEHAGPSEMMEDDTDTEVGPHGERHAHPA
jgi:hypothetical protein